MQERSTVATDVAGIYFKIGTNRLFVNKTRIFWNWSAICI